MAKYGKGKTFLSRSRWERSKLLRRVVIIGSSVLLLLIVLMIAGYFQLLNYLQGDAFRTRLTDGIQSGTRAGQVELLSNLHIDGSRISLDGVNVADMGHIQQANAGRTSTEINRAALLARKLHLRKLSVEDATLIYTTASAPASDSENNNTRRINTIEQEQPQVSPSKESRFTPNFQLDLFECKDADVHVTHNKKSYQLLGANVTATPAPKISKEAWQLVAENARFHTPFSFLRDSSIKSATLVYRSKGIDLTECRVMLTPGEMRAKAHYDLKRHRWTGDIQVNKGDIRRILNEDWKKRFTGQLYGRMVLTGDKKGFSTATGNLSVQNGVLEGLPLLSQIPIGNTRPYRTVDLDKAECQLLYPYNDDQLDNAWIFDEINISAKGGLLLVRGHVIVGDGGKLGGTLTIGVPEYVVDALPASRAELADQLFTAEGDEEGYMWVNMNLSGTIEHPKEDLSVRVAILVGRSLGDSMVKASAGAASTLLGKLLSQSRKETDSSTSEEPSNDEGEESDSYDVEDGEDTPDSPINNAAEAAGSLLRSLF